MIYILQTVLSFLLKIKNVNRIYKLIGFAVLSVLFVFLCLAASGVGFVYNVKYNGAAVAQIADKSVFYEAADIAASKVTADDARSLLETPELETVLAVGGGRSTAEELSQAVLENSPLVCGGYAVNIDGQTAMFIADGESFENALNARLSGFSVEGGECTNAFTSDITLEKTYFDASAASDGDASELIGSLDVVTTLTAVSSYETPYETVTERTSSELVGYKSVTTEGVAGLNEQTRRITYLNGQVTEDVIVSDIVISAPVNEVITIGTGKASYTVSAKRAAQSNFIWPIQSVSGQYISCYFGEDGGHKGVDIASKKGTEIYAVQSGTVTEAGYRSDYGYYVIVDHGNGLKTRYAHACQLLVSSGDAVVQGQTIALVGSTGISTGNHLHFEVLLNGTPVDPAPYIGY